MTNYEKIKNMSVEEMAEFISSLTNSCINGCKVCAFNNGKGCKADTYDNPFIKGCMEWLNKEVSE